jgi:hypothetical protein
MRPNDHSFGLTLEVLKEILHYDPETGVFTWKIRPANCIQIGAVAGSICLEGYRIIRVFKHNYKAHRLAWLYMTGEWPTYIDHANGDKADNRICNIRPCTKEQNGSNRRRLSNNTSGFKGVTFRPDKKLRPWVAQIKTRDRSRYLGCFCTPEEAHNAYVLAAREAWGEFAKYE